MQRQGHPKRNLDDYIAMVVENISLGNLTTEQLDRELAVFALTLLSVVPKTMKAGA